MNRSHAQKDPTIFEEILIETAPSIREIKGTNMKTDVKADRMV